MNLDIVSMTAAGAASGSAITLGVVWGTAKVLLRRYGPSLILRILAENFPEWQQAVCEVAKETCNEQSLPTAADDRA